MDLNHLKKQAQEELKKAKTKDQVRLVVKKFLGPEGKVSQGFKKLKELSPWKSKEQGQALNKLKDEMQALAKAKTSSIEREAIAKRIEQEFLDVTQPGISPRQGHLHPLTKTQEEACDIFKSMGFSVALGPEIETEWYNFDALNIPKDHPARDMWDTFWLRCNLSPKLLRTHTSPVQIRYLEKHQPPLRIVAPGRVFRNERTDASHDVQFYQLEGLMVGKKISAANFKAIIQGFLKRFFEAEVDMRLRPSFFPFTEPSFEIDMRRPKGEWLEIMGAGMVHPNVLRAAGHSPAIWQGFAFGVGLDRLAMLRYNINDIRLFYQNDLRFLRQF